MLQHIIPSKARRKILELFFQHPSENYYLRRVVRETDEEVNAVKRELDILSDEKLLLKERRLNKVYYTLNKNYHFYDEFLRIFTKTGLISTLIYKNLSKIGKIKFIALSTKFAKNIIIKEDEIAFIEGKETLTGIATKNGHRIKADVLTVGVGVTCPIDVLHAQESIQNKQGIVTNEYLETSQKDIWAAGDCAEYFDTILDEYVQMGNWANAQLQGKIAGLNMTGKRTAFAAVTTYTCSGFGLSIAFVGDVRKGEGKELIERIPDDTRSYCHVIIKDNRVIGAAMINRTAELPAITALIKNKIDISNKKDILVSGNIATL